MNKIYRIVRNPSTGNWVVTSELASSGKKNGKPGHRISVAVVVGASLLAANAHAQVVVGPGGYYDGNNAPVTITTSASTAHAITVDGGTVVLGSHPMTLTTTGLGAHGIQAENGSQVTLGKVGSSDNYSIDVSGNSAYGIAATGSTVNATGLKITTRGANSSGVRAEGDSVVTLDNSSIDTYGSSGTNSGVQVVSGSHLVMNGGHVHAHSPSYSYGLDISNASANLTDVEIITEGSNSHAINAVGAPDKAIVITGGSITANGQGSNALHLQNKAAVVSGTQLYSAGGYAVETYQSAHLDISTSSMETVATGKHALWLHGGKGIPNSKVTDSTIITHGDDAHGVLVTSETAVDITGGSIHTYGNDAYGLGLGLVGGGGDKATITGTTITTEGTYAHGLAVNTATGSVTAIGANIKTRGDESIAAYAINGARMDFTAGTITTEGKMAHALTLRQGNATLDGTTIKASGQDSAGFYLQGSKAQANTIQALNANVASDKGVAVLVRGASNTLSLENTQISGNGTLFDIRYRLDAGVPDLNNPGKLTVNAKGGSLTGATRLDAGSRLDIDLSDGALWTITTAAADAYGPALPLSLDESLVDRLDNGGVIVFAAPTTAGAFKTLTVRGDYIGNGGTLVMNTALGDDNSLSDRVVIEGNTSGNTFVQVKNAGGAGAQTDNGIQLISVAGASNGVFELQGRAIAGLYDYQLYKGGRNTPDDGGWYLRSEALPVPPAPPAPPVNPPAPPVNPPAPPVNPPAPPVEPEVVDPPTPALRPEPAAYLGNQNAALRMFQHTMHDRVGEPGLTARDDDGQGYAAWVRVQNRNLDTGTVGGQIDIDTNANIMQMGVEKQFAVGEGRIHAGVMGGYGRATTDGVSNFTDHKARGEVKGTNLGVYGTWFQNAEGPEGLYVDGWMQYGRFDNTVKGDYLGHEQYDSRTWSGSVEAGYGFNVHSGERYDVYVEPQAQVIYTDFSSDDVREDNGTLVQSRKAGGTTTRLGARVYSRPLGNAKNRVQPFAAVNWWSGGNASTIAMDGERLSRDLPKNTYEAKAGAQLELGQGWSGWGQLGYQQGSNGYRDVNGQAGVKLSW